MDGHDIGSGQMNIFIYTESPEILFKKILTLHEMNDLIPIMKAAYRKYEGGEYNIIWPTGLTVFEIL